MTSNNSSDMVTITMIGSFKLKQLTWKKEDHSIGEAKKFPIEKMYEGKLRQVGRVLMGCCPFHKEENPSFAIYPEENTWHCFAEGIGGDAISYYMKKTGLSFVKSIENLSQKQYE